MSNGIIRSGPSIENAYDIALDYIYSTYHNHGNRQDFVDDVRDGDICAYAQQAECGFEVDPNIPLGKQVV